VHKPQTYPSPRSRDVGGSALAELAYDLEVRGTWLRVRPVWDSTERLALGL
jgi:hypothetical protein